MILAQPNMQKYTSHTIKIRDIWFRRTDISFSELYGTMKQPLTLVFIALMTALYLIMDQTALLGPISIIHTILVWIGGLALQVALFSTVCLIYAYLQFRFSLGALYLPIANIIALTINYPASTLHLTYHSGISFFEVFNLQIMLSMVFLALLFEALFFSFVFPLLRSTYHGDKKAASRLINVAGESIDIETIITLRGQEHYVLVTTENGTRKLRARLGDLISQTDEQDGVLAHRSYWVSRKAIKSIAHQENGTGYIEIKTGERLSIARPRQVQVQNWARKYGLTTG